MTGTRNRNAWMWLAVAAMAVVSLARVQAGNATVYTNPVLEFLAGHPDAAGLGAARAPPHARQSPTSGSARRASAVFLHHAAPGAWTATLPVMFVGLVTPLSLVSPTSLLSLVRTPPAPQLPSSFQRPPPALA